MEYILVDLKEYGFDGMVKMGPPTYRQRNKSDNQIGRAHHFVEGKNGVQIESQDLGDITLYGIFKYIREAPFSTEDIESFLSFTDTLDEVRIGNGERFVNRLIAEVKRIQAGACDPLANSPVTETPESDSKSTSKA